MGQVDLKYQQYYKLYMVLSQPIIVHKISDDCDVDLRTLILVPPGKQEPIAPVRSGLNNGVAHGAPTVTVTICQLQCSATRYLEMTLLSGWSMPLSIIGHDI